MTTIRFRTLVLIIFLAIASTDPAPGSLFYLAPQTQIHPVPEITIGKERIPWTANNISERLRQGGFNRKFENAVLDFLNKKRYNSDEEFRQISAPFEIFLSHHLCSYFFATSYHLLWKNAPSLKEKERFLNLFLDHYPNLQHSHPCENVFYWILVQIIDEALPISIATAERLENFCLGFHVFTLGMAANSTYLLRFLSQEILRFRTQPDRNCLRYLLRDAPWDLGSPARISTHAASDVLTLADQLSALDDPPTWIKEWNDAYRRFALSQFEDLGRQLKPCDKIKSITLRRNSKPTQGFNVKVHFKSQEDGRAFQSSTSNLRKRISAFMVEADGRKIVIEFVYPIDNGRAHPAFLSLTFKNSRGALVEEYLDFYSDGTFKFENEFLELNGCQAIQREQNTIRVHLPELAKLLGARSRVLSYFYLQGPDESAKLCEIDGKDSVENSI